MDQLSSDEFLALNRVEQDELLFLLAKKVTHLLDSYPSVYKVASDSLDLVEMYLVGNNIPATEVCQYLNHSDPNQDLSAQFDFVNEDEDAIAALNIICYATGSVGNTACKRQRVTCIPDTVLSVTPDVAVNTLKQDDLLVKK